MPYTIDITPPAGVTKLDECYVYSVENPSDTVNVPRGFYASVSGPLEPNQPLERIRRKYTFIPSELPAQENLQIVCNGKEIGKVQISDLKKSLETGNHEVLTHYMEAALKTPGLDFNKFAEQDNKQEEKNA